MNITVFCSARDLSEVYTKPAVEFARLLAGGGHTLVWGGSDGGLMKQIADAAQAAGAKIVGISVELLKDVVRKNADEIIITKTMGERKALLLERGDAIVVLVGGLGTLAEVMEVADFKKLGVHNKPIIFLNTNNFYEGLIKQLNKMHEEGFIQPEINSLLTFARTPQEVMSFLSLSYSDNAR
jgi:uncharacterized protein (TIGR00730 family)